MPDWQKLVSHRLAALSLEPQGTEEVLAELASHLEETYDALRMDGVPEEDAIHHVLSQVPDWNELQRKIQSTQKENTMSPRVTRFWFPALITFVISMSLLAATQIFGPQPLILHPANYPVVTFYVFWLVALPLIGALGAYLSHRAEGSLGTLLVSSVFSVLPFLASILIVLPVSLAFDHFIAHNMAPMALVTALFGWVLAPGTALFAGGLLAGLLLSSRSTSRGVTTG
ncbi:MAG TPA: permease prefix domain 1-containing protein [Candidatus Dormibacteraeota bacterium]|nr:permease prefix domain 1-containing protein [Candidatus Dormibacteraeota bacterium]